MLQFDISWSFAAFKKAGKDFLAIHSQILAELEGVAERANGWFFHVVEIDGGWLRCDAHPDSDSWTVYIREARYVPMTQREGDEKPHEYPELVQEPDNDRFASFEEILALMKT